MVMNYSIDLILRGQKEQSMIQEKRFPPAAGASCNVTQNAGFSRHQATEGEASTPTRLSVPL